MPARDSWGAFNVVKWNDLIDPEKGYILDDTIKITVVFTGTTISVYTFHDNADEQLKELLSKYVENNLANSRDQIETSLKKSNEIEEEKQQPSSQETDNSYETTCIVCKEKYSDIIELKRIPRILSGCPTNYKHSICEGCAEKLMKDGDIECPFDRSITKVPNRDVRKLTKNGLLLDLLAEETFRRRQDTTPIPQFQNTYDAECCAENRSHIATEFCVNCQLNFCSSCLHDIHSRPSLSQHTTVSINEKTKNVQCPNHLHNFVNLYCIEDDCKGKRIMCPSCYLYGTHKIMYITSEKKLIFRISNILDLGLAGHKCFEDYADPNLWRLKVKRIEFEKKDCLEMSLSSKKIDSDEEWVRRTDRKVKITSKKSDLILEITKDVYLLEWERLIDLENEYIIDGNHINVEITVEMNIGFQWKFPKSSILEDEYTRSDEFHFLNIPWKVEANIESSEKTKEKYLGAYLHCYKNKNDSSYQSVKVNFSISLLSQKQGINDIVSQHKNSFTSENVGWGTWKLFKWNDLIDPEKGYILDDTIEIKIMFAGTTGLDYISHAETDEKLEELVSKYVEKNMENSREQISNQIEEGEQHISSQATENSDETICGICTEKYSDIIELKRIPRILSGCETKHTICESCAENILVNGTIKCPFDRSITKVPDGDVRKLTKNGYLLDLLADETFKSNKINTYDDVFCDDDSSHIATKYCLECQANFCSSCLNAIHNRPAFSKHTVVSINEKIQNVRCPEHSRNYVELYCIEKDCKGKRIMCPSCYLYGTHKGHKHEEFEKKLKWLQESWQNNMNFVGTTMKTLEKEKQIIDKFHGMLQEDGEAVEAYATPILDTLTRKIIESVNRQKKEYLQKCLEDFDGLHRKIEAFDTKMKNINTELLTQKKSDISIFLESCSTYPNQESLFKKELEDIISSFSPTTIPRFNPENLFKIANDAGVYTRIVICSLFQKDSEHVRKLIEDDLRQITETVPLYKNLRKYKGNIVEFNPNFHGLGKNQYDSVIILVSRKEFENQRNTICAFTKTLSNYIVAVERAGISGEIDFGTMKGVLYDSKIGGTCSIIEKLLS